MRKRWVRHTPVLVACLRSALIGAVVVPMSSSGYAQTYNADIGNFARLYCQGVPELAEQVYMYKISGILKAQLESIATQTFEDIQDEEEKARTAPAMLVHLWVIDRVWNSSAQSPAVRESLAQGYRLDCQDMLYELLMERVE